MLYLSQKFYHKLYTDWLVLEVCDAAADIVYQDKVHLEYHKEARI